MIYDIACILACYIIGNINISFAIGRHHGHDVKKEGSKNAGATNIMILVGKSAFVLVACFDIFKAWTAWKIAEKFISFTPYPGMVGGVACALGHIYPAFYNFDGGKGFACLGGLILAFRPWLFPVQLVLALIICFVTNYLCIASSLSTFIFAGVYGYITRDVLGTVLAAVFGTVLTYKHFENFRRIREGTELRIRNYIFDKEKEIRATGHGDELDGKL